jgi:hypothetical protein
MDQSLPVHLTRLHEGEEFVRGKGVEAIEASADFSMHASLIETSMDLINYFCLKHVAKDDDMLTEQLLGIRMFNGIASAFTLLLSGYYQTSALQQRDLLETIFLLGYFQTDRTLIARWRAGDDRERRKDFAPAAVRKALDKRDGFTERKREKAYQALCELAAHPTYAGFRMLAPITGGDAHCGPFFEYTAFKAVYEELAKRALECGAAFTVFFNAASREDHLTKIRFMESQGCWLEKFYGRPFDRSKLNELRSFAETLATTS